LQTTTALLVEDDARLARLTADYLQANDMSVTIVGDGQSAIEESRKLRYDVVLLDVMLPKVNGIEVCRTLRAESDVPIIILTARGEEADRVLGLEIGADDYLAKPFSPRELLARINAIMRRSRGRAGPPTRVVRAGGLLVNPVTRTASLNDVELPLTSYEFTLLRVLAERAGRVLSREQIMELAKGTAEDAFDRSVDVHISRLRQKLAAVAGGDRMIKTVRGAGYVLAASEDA
jgi:two-component system OmpR family response regulator